MTDKDVRRITEEIGSSSEAGKMYLAAIDGRCASGKTTLASLLQERMPDCAVVHMDHFFLRDEQRTKERLAAPGENVDHERVLSEVIRPLKEGKTVQYCPYDCSIKGFREPVRIMRKQIIIVEGSYSCHPELWDLYDLRVFLTTSYEEQMKRIQRRNGMAAAEVFRSKWIPLEEMYFSEYRIEERCDMRFET